MRYLLLTQMLLLTSLAFGGDHPPATCELAPKNILSRSPAGFAQVSNLREIEITCRIPGRPLPTKPGDGLMGLRVETTVSEIAADGSRTLVPSKVSGIGGGREGVGTASDTELEVFQLLIPLEPADADVEARILVENIERSMSSDEISGEAHQLALQNCREFIREHRVGHFLVECHVVDGKRVVGVGNVELEVLFKGRFTDMGFYAVPPA